MPLYALAQGKCPDRRVIIRLPVYRQRALRGMFAKVGSHHDQWCVHFR